MSDDTATRATVLQGVDPSWLSVPAGVLAAGTVLQYAPLATGAARMLAITVFCIALWVGAPVKPWFTALLGIGLIGVTFSTSLALTGFQSPATWLVIVGILIGDIKDEGKTVFLIDHVMRALMTVSERVMVLNYGHLIAEGTPTEIQNDDEVIEAYLGEHADKDLSNAVSGD